MVIRVALACLVLGLPGPASAAPQRVVSLNLCTDQLLIALAAPGQIGAVSMLARDPALSAAAGSAARLPVTRGDFESVWALRPDLVLAGRYTTRATVALLRARGVPVAEFDLVEDLDAVRAEVRAVASLLGREDAGRAVLADFDRALGPETAPDDHAPAALAYAAGGFVAGRGTLLDAVLRQAGYRNAAAVRGIVGYGYLPLERLLVAPPDVLIVGERDAAPSLAALVADHPALVRLGLPRLAVPSSWLSCGGPALALAVERLAGARPR